MVLKRKHIQELAEILVQKLEESGINVAGAEQVIRDGIKEYLEDNES